MKEDMARNQMTTEMAEGRKHWHVMSCLFLERIRSFSEENLDAITTDAIRVRTGVVGYAARFTSFC